LLPLEDVILNEFLGNIAKKVDILLSAKSLFFRRLVLRILEEINKKIHG